ncbi:4Fe-4S dicluster domain-containing protein [Chloroflexota bacterium]
MTKQLGFIIDVSRCVMCRTCEITCKSVRNVEPGIRWRKVIDTWTGEFPNVKRSFFSQSCMHCAKPACLDICPTGAIYKRPEDGIVMVDRNKCNGCKDCASACPWGVPEFGTDGIMQKCDFCVGTGGQPSCVAPCPAEALSFGSTDEIPPVAAGKTAEKMTRTTRPSVIVIRNNHQESA